MDKLAMRVLAVNKSNQLANEWRPKLIEAVRPFVGQKIYTAAGPLLAKVQKVVDALNMPSNTKGVFDGGFSTTNIYKNDGSYSLKWNVHVSLWSGGTDNVNASNDVSMYIAHTRNDCLESLYIIEPSDVLKTDWTSEDVAAKREAMRAAKKALSEAETALIPFGDYDR